jgi:hypothetical protein
MTILKAGDQITIKDASGSSVYRVGYVTNDKRCLIDMGMGTWVGADLTDNEGWQISPNPCSADETGFIENQPDFGKTVTEITKDPG